LVKFLIVGESGSGKTTIVNELESYGYYSMPSYTDRLPRNENEKGHIFIKEEDYKKSINNDEIAGYTYFDRHNYYTKKEQIRDKTMHLYIIDPKGIDNLKENVPDVKYITIYIKTREFDRIMRMRNRGDKTSKIKKRILNDHDMFKNIKYDYAVTNENLEKAVQVIKRIIEVETQN
jgi:guanylate kinase